MSNVYEILDVCLQEIDNGADLDSVLFRYPEYAEELRPILETSVKAREVAVAAPSTEVVRRNRAKVLQHAAQMREAKVPPSRRMWSVPLRRMLVSLAVIAALFLSSTGLVRAASTTVPGDNLYPVKRTWEDVLLLLTFNAQARQTLEVEHENERLDELKALFAAARSAEVEFSGLVTRQNGDLWLVAGIPVVVSSQTDLPNQAVAVGDAVQVEGVTQTDGAVLAEKVELLPAGVPLPSVADDDSFEFGDDQSENSNESGEDNSGKDSGEDSADVEETETAEPESNSGTSDNEPREQTLNGIVDSINGNIVIVNGQVMDVGYAEVKGTPQPGATVKVEGYYDATGIFIVTKIEYQSSGSNSGSGSDSGSSDDVGNDNNSNDDNSSDDHGNDDASDDNSGGDDSDDNSGSGGGDDD